MNLRKNNFLTVLAAISIMLLSQNIMAQDTKESNTEGFNFEANADYVFNNTKYDGNIIPDSKTNYVMGGLAYYFDTVDTSEGPLALSTFFDRASGIQASFGIGQFDSDGQDADFNILNLAGTYVHKSSGWLAYGNYNRTKVDTNSDNITNTYAITAGKYFAENSILTLGYRKIDADLGGSSTFTLSNFHAQDLGNGTYFDGGLAISYIDFDDSGNAFEFALETTYYFTKAIGLGITGAYTTGNDMNSFLYGLNAEWFVANNFSINALYNRINNNNDGIIPDFDNNILSAGLKLRF